MSHFVSISLKIKDIEALRRAVNVLGYTLIENAIARGYRNKKADYVIRLSGPYDVAVVRKGDYYELEADFWQGHVERELGKGLSKLKREYAKQLALAVAEQNGFELESMREEENGDLVIELAERW